MPGSKSETPSVTVDKKGITIPWKLISIVVAAIVGGGGGVWGLNSVFGSSAASATELQSFKKDQDSQHQVIGGDIKGLKEGYSTMGDEVKGLKSVVGAVQTTQQRDIASREARRVTEDIPSRVKRESEFERIQDLNLRRLARGQDPCGSVSCE